ncbi:MAG: helix-turn-helix transcriptional regulator [Treponema sp.]|nr:helix-turn-helix transcriptional regulator [Treponema sp.]
MGFKETLKDELTFQDMQTKELAVKTGISLSTLNHYLSGNGNVPSAENAIKIARTLGVSVEYLMTGRDSDLPCGMRVKVKKLISELNYLSDADLDLVGAVAKRLKKS